MEREVVIGRTPLSDKVSLSTLARISRLVTGRQFFRDVGSLTVANLIVAALSVAQGILVARWLGPRLYGLATLVMAYPAFVHAFFDARSSEAVVKYVGEFDSRGESERGHVMATCKLAYMVDLSIASFALILVTASSGWAAERIAHFPQAAWLMTIYAAALVPRALVGASHGLLTAMGKFTLIARLEIFTTLIRVTLVIWFISAGRGVAGVILGNVIAMAAGGFLYGVTASMFSFRKWGLFPLRGKVQVLAERRREIFKFLFYTNLNALMGMVSKQFDVVLLGYLRQPIDVGFYKLSKNFAGLVGYVVQPLQSVTYPRLVREWVAGGVVAFWLRVKRFARLIGLPLGILTLVGILFVRPVLHLLLGEAYLSAVLGTQVYLVAMAWQSAFFWLRPAFMAANKFGIFLSLSAFTTIVLMVGWVALIPSFGYLGLIAAVVAVSILHTSVGTLLLSRSIREDVALRTDA